MSEERRKHLKQMKEEIAGDSTTADNASSSSLSSSAGFSNQDDELLPFIQNLRERDKNRKQQLSIIKKLYEDPISFGLQNEIIPSSTNAEEIAARKKDLQYRIDILRAILEAAEGEMQLLSDAGISGSENNEDMSGE